MIDRATRDFLVARIKGLVSGRLTNIEFEEGLPPRSDDPAIFEIFLSGPWQLYSDFGTTRFTRKNPLPLEAKSQVARWLLFLKTDLPYEWPRTSFLFLVGNLLTLGAYGKFARRRLRATAPFDLWPFYRQSDYETALQTLPYLNGASN